MPSNFCGLVDHHLNNNPNFRWRAASFHRFSSDFCFSDIWHANKSLNYSVKKTCSWHL